MKHIKLFESFTSEYNQLIDKYIGEIKNSLLVLFDDYDAKIRHQSHNIFIFTLDFDINQIDIDHFIREINISLDKLKFNVNGDISNYSLYSVNSSNIQTYIFGTNSIEEFDNKLEKCTSKEIQTLFGTTFRLQLTINC